MSISSTSESIKIPQQQADLLTALLRLSPVAPIETVTRLVLQDSYFCDRLLDVLFERRPPNITEAIIHDGIHDLGVERVRLLFLAHSISRAFDSHQLHDFDLGDFWVSSFRKAFGAYKLAAEIEYPNTYEAFTAGLLADVGNLLLATRFPHLSESFRDIRSRPVEARSMIERILVGCTHTEEIQTSGLTHLIPPRIMQALEQHIDPFPGSDRQSTLTILVGCAVAIADIGQTTPAAPALKLSENLLRMLPKPFSIKEIFEYAENQSNQMARNLGYEVGIAHDLNMVLEEKPQLDIIEDDPLANLFSFVMEKQVDNRTGFMQKLQEKIEDTTHTEDFSIMLIDLDSFSKLNHTYGFPTGDSLLSYLGHEIAKSARALDHVARIDADQFALILPKTQAMGAKVVAERIRALVKSSTIAMGTIRPNCTASVGGLTVKVGRKVKSHTDIWDKVVQLTKMAKEKGRNRIIWAS